MKLTKLEKKILMDIASIYGGKLRFIRQKDVAFWYWGDVVLGEFDTLTDTLSAFFHELGHHGCWTTKKYLPYHTKGGTFLYNKTIKQVARYALNAELKADQIGKELMAFWFPTYRYIPGYKNDKESLAFLRGYYLKFAIK